MVTRVKVAIQPQELDRNDTTNPRHEAQAACIAPSAFDLQNLFYQICPVSKERIEVRNVLRITMIDRYYHYLFVDIIKHLVQEQDLVSSGLWAPRLANCLPEFTLE